MDLALIIVQVVCASGGRGAVRVISIWANSKGEPA